MYSSSFKLRLFRFLKKHVQSGHVSSKLIFSRKYPNGDTVAAMATVIVLWWRWQQWLYIVAELWQRWQQ